MVDLNLSDSLDEIQLLSAEEIDSILAQLSTYTECSITEITPREISRMTNEEQKQEYIDAFKKVNELYVKPLENTLNYLINQRNKEKFHFSFDDFSIKDRLRMIQRELMQFGLTIDQILDLVPKNETEISLLASAIERGYRSNKIVNNEYRMKDAQDYLDHVNKTGAFHHF